MKVLHCIPGMGGGGAERQLAYLAGPLAALGWQVHVALVADGPNLARLQSADAVVHRLSSVTSYDPRLAWSLATLVRQVRPDLIQTWFVQMDVIGGGVASLLGVPWILSERSSILAYPPTWKNRLRVAIGRRADAIISNSHGGDEYWAARAPARVNRSVVPNAVPNGEIEAAIPALPADLAIGRDHAVILCVARLEAEKNIDTIFDALSLVVRRPGIVGVLCGDGPLRQTIRDRIASRGLSGRIFAPGYIRDFWPVLKRADVVVAAGRFEGRANAVVEAMAAGRPLVVSDIPANREILQDVSAVWVDPGDPRSIAAGIERVLHQPEAAERRAAAARASVLRWSTESVAAEYDRVYRLMLSRRRRH